MKVKKFYIYCIFTLVSLIMFIMSFSIFPFSRALFLIDSCITFIIIFSLFILIRNYISHILCISKNVKLFLEDESYEILNSISEAVVIADAASDGNIIFYNDTFEKKFLSEEKHFFYNIREFLPSNFDKNALFTNGIRVKFNDKKFVVFCKKSGEYLVFNFFDNTSLENLKLKYNQSQISICLAVFDNKEEIYQSFGEDQGLKIKSCVENELLKWANDVSGIFKKLSDEKYLIIFREKYLKYHIKNKFDIINKIHDIKIDSHKFATISLGISKDCENLNESKKWAENALNMALGRGGDQVVLKSSTGYEFFGGTSQGLEKRSKVRTRVVAMALLEKVQNSDSVFIMGHKMSDFDSMGAAIGLWGVLSQTFNKPIYIVLDESNSMALPLLQYIKHYTDLKFIISPKNAIDKVSNESFLIVVDTHSEKFLEDYKFYHMFNHIAVIDHHRMTVDKIDASDIFFHEPSVSSTCEMVTEIIQYMGNKYLKQWQAECLLAGIMLDTKNFSLKSGVRTFEAAAYLKKKGADSTQVKKLFSDSMEVHKIKCRIIESADIIEGCAIAKYENIENFSKIACVQAADELLDIKNIEASFVIFQNPAGKIDISARSLGKINVQVIMELLGGGGHQTMAAASVENSNILEVEEKLRKIIEMNV